MNQEVKRRRRYDASRRRAAAQETRQAIVEAARRLFLERGFTATTMAAIAAAAGVSHETVYAFGPKPALFRHLVEIALSGSDSPVPGMERDYARQVMAETDPGRLFDIYARAMRETQQRLAPLFDVLSDGARTDPDLKALSDGTPEGARSPQPATRRPTRDLTSAAHKTAALSPTRTRTPSDGRKPPCTPRHPSLDMEPPGG